MKKHLFLLPMAVSIAALMNAAPDTAQAKTTIGIDLPRASIETGVAESNPIQELVLKRAEAAGVKFADHESHASHESHSSHESHASHTSGY